MYSGSCVQDINDTEYEMKQGQLMLMSPGIVHTINKLGTDDILIQIALGQNNLTHGFFNRISSTGIVSNFLLNAFTSNNRLDDFFYFLPKAVGGFGSSSQNFSVSGMNLLQHLTIC